ncbi:MAG: acetylxylan esterase [Clostridia bacterium]|nr:acetylxylan esterase [Clostridia bacterium]
MPMLDMPLEQLKGYRGMNPKPADFDAFWDASVAEMKAVDPRVELRPADFQAPQVRCLDLYFTGVGGARIHARLACPPEDGALHPAVAHFHGYTGSAADFLYLLPYAYAGFYIASIDVRGQGGESQDMGSADGPTVYGHIVNGLLADDPRQLFFRRVFLDVAQLAGILMDMPQVDAARVGCMGGSQGGALTLACAALEPRIALAAPYYPWLCDYQRVWDMDMAINAYVGLKDFFRHFDPTHAREKEIFTRLGYIDVQHLAPRIRAKVMMGTGLMDNVCPPSTQFAAYNKITSEKQMVLYPDFGHEYLPRFEESTFTFMMQLR